MDNSRNKRRAKRLDFPCEARICFLGQPEYVGIVVKDISASGIRIVVPARPVKIDEPVDIKLRLKGRDIECRGKVSWALMLRPGLGNVSITDVGIEFINLGIEDREFLEKIIV